VRFSLPRPYTYIVAQDKEYKQAGTAKNLEKIPLLRVLFSADGKKKWPAPYRGWATSCYKKIETPIRAKTRIRRPYTMNLSVVFNPLGVSTSRKYLYISDIISLSIKSRGAIIGKIIGKKIKAVSRMVIGAGGLGFSIII